MKVKVRVSVKVVIGVKVSVRDWALVCGVTLIVV